MTGYADINDVYAQLLITPGGPDDPIVQRVGRLNESLSRVFDQKVGMTWAEDPVTASTKAVPLQLVHDRVGYWNGYGYRLPLPVPVRSVTAIEAGGTWNGTTWDDGEAVAAADWFLPYPADKLGNVWEILFSETASPDAVWPWQRPPAPLRITAIWGDNPGDAVPPEVRDALTWLVVHHYREETSSPAGQIGPDGLLVTIRNPWAYERVTTVIERYKLVPPLAV